MNLVTGYAGPGAHPVDENVDASAHGWGGQAAGTTGERVLAAEFGAGNPIDIHHAFFRWNGYPERIDPAGPQPVLVAPQRKGGKEIVLRAEGSNIQTGAALVVDRGGVVRSREEGREVGGDGRSAQRAVGPKRAGDHFGRRGTRERRG